MPKIIFDKKIPIFGICYGLQLIAKMWWKNKVIEKKRNSEELLSLKKIFTSYEKFFKSNTAVWMSHEDAVVKLPNGFKNVAYTQDSKLTIIENRKKNIYGVQFHPSNSYR